MKRFKSGLMCVCLAVSLFTAFAATGCGGGNTGAPEGVLTVSCMETGYGYDWLQQAAKEFEATHEGITVKVDPDATLEGKIPTALSSGQNLSDIYMCLDVPWREWVSKGYIANLTSVYDAEVEKLDGSKVKVKDYMLDEVSEKFYAQRNVNSTARPYAMPWALVQVGIGYNEDILLATPHTTTVKDKWKAGDNWNAPPESVSELLDYCKDLNARNIAPFVFTGKEHIWQQFMMYTWWAQYQGVSTPSDKVPGEGSYYDFWQQDSLDVYKQTGIVKAIETFQSIMVDLNTQSYKNVYGMVDTYSTQDAERNFVTGNSAMILGGSFLYNEMQDYLDLNHDGKDDYTFKMMPVPYLDDGIKNADGTPTTMTFYSSEDVMFIPAKATNLELAKEFLAYLCSEKSLCNFSKSCGSIRPFKYDASNVEGAQYSEFTKSVMKIYNETDVKLFAYPVGTPYEEISPIFSFYRPYINGGMLQADFSANVRKYPATKVMENVMGRTETEFPKWKQELGID